MLLIQEADDYDSDAAVAALKKLENTVPANLTLDYDVEDEENLSVTTETTDAAGVKEAIEQCIDNDGAAPDPANYGVWVPGIPVLLESGLDAIGCVDWLKRSYP